ncbi:LacI family DNA-binding transcriptional regulator [Micromonospora cremea]|uniref:DNA-binding transcriptional regulator, LacI/PurR family n=1 Tax=Micromonospora cremea TaxID=709881 RepID=A0A1N5UXW4_9ACTN|nr:LacI family DNA-binding transcriptional regulator [Micromonospora cremea]SIM65370.1 DNA-binding transcriptional regulator, LacI/PurR family [Micromonospora cremea]
MASTLKDVARLADVSVKTVSNVVNGYPHVSPDVRRRVEAAVTQLGYRPNVFARTLRTGRTGVLALVLPDSDVPYADDLAREVVRAARSRGYRVVIEQMGPDDERPAPSLSAARTMPVDGVLVSAPVAPAELVEALPATGRPVVLVGGEARDGRCDQVSVDVARAAEDATAHLLRAGRRRIAAIGAYPTESAAVPRSRTAGYYRALREAGVAPVPGHLLPAGHHRRADGYRAARALLARPGRPDAIFCYSDPLAIGAMRAAFDAGLRVPGDVAVIGIGDIEEGRYSRPTLSTVSVDTGFLAREAVARVTTRIDQPDAAVAMVTAPHTVLPRESTETTMR